MIDKPLGLAYVASPYTLYAGGITNAFVDAARITARLMLAGIHTYSPIVASHPLAVYGKINPLDHTIWLPLNDVMLEKCDVLIVARMEGWDKSAGVAHEIEVFERARKPIYDLEPESLTMIRRENCAPQFLGVAG